MGVAYATISDRLTGKRFASAVDLAPDVRAYLFRDAATGEVLVSAWGLYGADMRVRDLSPSPLRPGPPPGSTS